MLVLEERLCLTFEAIAPVGPKAGDEGWSVIVTMEALARAATMEGSPAPAIVVY